MSFRQRHGPSGLLVTLIAAALVFGGYFLYMGIINWVEADTIARQTSTRAAQLTQTEDAIAAATQGFMPFPTNTSVPQCETYYVNVSSAWVRRCPSLTCEAKDNKPNQADVCVLGRADPAEFPVYSSPGEWYVVDLNEGLIFPDVGYMHESVLSPRNPTPRPSQTFTPLPTVTPLPTPSPGPTGTSTPTITPSPDPDDSIIF